jgi:hypothetical protein
MGSVQMSSTVLITLNNYDLPDIRCVKSFDNIDWGTVDCLIFHSTTHNEMLIPLELSKIKDRVGKIIYINKSINPLFYCIFTGMNADIYDIEDYLMDKEMLSFLIDSYKSTGMTVKSPSADIETLAKYIAALSTSSFDSIQKMISNGFWLKTLDTAVSNVGTALSRASKININVLDMLGETTKLINTIEASNESTSLELAQLKEVIEDMSKKARPNTPFMFSTYSVPVNVQKVLYVKAVGNCRYLNSFLLAYQHYLKMNHSFSSKILFVFPKLKNVMSRYKDIPRLAMDTIDIMDIGASNIYATYEPKNAIWEAFFDQPKTGVFIVVDLMFGDDLVKGHMVETLYSASGISDLKRFNIKAERTIFCIYNNPGSIQICHISKYHTATESTKRSMYFDHCGDAFKKLDKFILKERR